MALFVHITFLILLLLICTIFYLLGNIAANFRQEVTEIEKKDVKMWFLTNKIRWEMFPMNIEKIIIEVGKNDDMLKMNFFPLKMHNFSRIRTLIKN